MTDAKTVFRRANVLPHEMGADSDRSIVHASRLISQNYCVRVSPDGPVCKTQAELLDAYLRDQDAELELLVGCYYRCYGLGFASKRCLEECESALGPLNTGWQIRPRAGSRFWLIYNATRNSPDLRPLEEIAGVPGSRVCAAVPIPGESYIWDAVRRPPAVLPDLAADWLRGLPRVGTDTRVIIPPPPRRYAGLKQKPSFHQKPIRY
jgi:hypothetical protein